MTVIAMFSSRASVCPGQRCLNWACWRLYDRAVGHGQIGQERCTE